eukprot:m51a1_g12773 hypothetical protein (474) ;mRNA; r:998-3154
MSEEDGDGWQTGDEYEDDDAAVDAQRHPQTTQTARPVFCTTHKTEGYVYVTRRTCSAEDSKMMPSTLEEEQENEVQQLVLFVILEDAALHEAPFWAKERLGLVKCTLLLESNVIAHPDAPAFSPDLPRPAVTPFSPSPAIIATPGSLVSMASSYPHAPLALVDSPQLAAPRSRSPSEHREQPSENSDTETEPEEVLTTRPVRSSPPQPATGTLEHSTDGKDPDADHQQARMGPLRPLCIAKGCGRFAVFGESGGAAEYCVRHKTPGHDVRIVKPCRGRKCSVFGCKTQASFGELGGPIMFCKQHCKTNHVNLASRQCAEPGCKKIPTFGLPGSHAVFCAAHKAEGYVYVHRKPCPAQGCKKMPSFGPPGLPPVYCKDHMPEGYVLYTKKICVHEGCHEKPRWGLKGRRATYCDKHKGPEHVMAAPPRKNKRSRSSSSSSSSSSSAHNSKRHRTSRRSDSDFFSGNSSSEDSDM